ncbi:hypothetical protein LT18_06447 [Pseudomonas aeruginosa]|nr:hypothetical protein LT18_06447 [Pseudomonas aeruginosa]
MIELGKAPLHVGDLGVDVLATNALGIIPRALRSTCDSIPSTLNPTQVLQNLRGPLVDCVSVGLSRQLHRAGVIPLLLQRLDLRVDGCGEVVVLLIQGLRGLHRVLSQPHELGDGIPHRAASRLFHRQRGLGDGNEAFAGQVSLARQGGQHFGSSSGRANRIADLARHFAQSRGAGTSVVAGHDQRLVVFALFLAAQIRRRSHTTDRRCQQPNRGQDADNTASGAAGVHTDLGDVVGGDPPVTGGEGVTQLQHVLARFLAGQPELVDRAAGTFNVPPLRRDLLQAGGQPGVIQPAGGAQPTQRGFLLLKPGQRGGHRIDAVDRALHRFDLTVLRRNQALLLGGLLGFRLLQPVIGRTQAILILRFVLQRGQAGLARPLEQALGANQIVDIGDVAGERPFQLADDGYLASGTVVYLPAGSSLAFTRTGRLVDTAGSVLLRARHSLGGLLEALAGVGQVVDCLFGLIGGVDQLVEVLGRLYGRARIDLDAQFGEVAHPDSLCSRKAFSAASSITRISANTAGCSPAATPHICITTGNAV